MRGLLAQAVALCRRVAPDLAGRPLYIMWRHMLPVEMVGGELFGCTMRGLDAVLQPALERRQAWHGRGSAMLIDLHAIVADVRADFLSRATRRRYVRGNVLGVALHELAHIVVDFKAACDAEVCDPEPAPSPRQVAAYCALLAGYDPTKDPVPWADHEADFIRVALHLAARAAHPPIGVVDTACAYGWSPTSAYVLALGDEPARMQQWPLTRVLATAPPPEFVALWRSDLQARRHRVETELNKLRSALARCERQNAPTV